LKKKKKNYFKPTQVCHTRTVGLISIVQQIFNVLDDSIGLH